MVVVHLVAYHYECKLRDADDRVQEKQQAQQ